MTSAVQREICFLNVADIKKKTGGKNITKQVKNEGFFFL